MRLPRWDARSKRDRQAMHRWVCAQLEAQDDAELVELFKQANSAENVEANRAWRTRKGPLDNEIEAAHQGDIGPLRAALINLVGPDVAKFIQAPKRPRGAPRKRPASSTGDLRFRLKAAAADLPRIRQIWKEHYEGRQYRHDDLAMKIAAERWGVSVLVLANHLKNKQKFARNKSRI